MFEGVEDSWQQLRINTAAGIFHFDPKLPVLIISGTNTELPAIRRKFDRVLDQVPKNLLQTRRIGLEINVLGHKIGLDIEFFLFDLRMANLQRISQEGIGINDLEAELDLAFADPR